MSDNEVYLLEKAKRGDVEAFEALIEGHQKKVFNIALRMTGNREDAAEIAQEVFLKLFKSIRGFKGNSAFSTWLYRVATNVCIDELRKIKKRNTISLDEELQTADGSFKRQFPTDLDTPESRVETNEVKRIVTDAIRTLPEEYRIALILRDIQGFSYEELSKILKVPEGTVKSRINRGRMKLKEVLMPKRELFGYIHVK